VRWKARKISIGDRHTPPLPGSSITLGQYRCPQLVRLIFELEEVLGWGRECLPEAATCLPAAELYRPSHPILRRSLFLALVLSLRLCRFEIQLVLSYQPRRLGL